MEYICTKFLYTTIEVFFGYCGLHVVRKFTVIQAFVVYTLL